MPAPRPGSTSTQPDDGCIAGGVGAPVDVRPFGSRLWVKWRGCQVYEATKGAAALARPAPVCPPNDDISVGYGLGETVSELCAGTAVATLYEFNAQTAAVERTDTWPSLPWSSSDTRIPWYAWYPAPGGDFWTWAYQPGELLEIAPTGSVVQRYAFPDPDGAVTGTQHLWLVCAQGVATVPLAAG